MTYGQQTSGILPKALLPFNPQKRAKIPFFIGKFPEFAKITPHPYFQGSCTSPKAILDDIYTFKLMNNWFKWKKLQINSFLAYIGGSYV